MERFAGEPPTRERIAQLAGGDPLLSLSDLHAGYGKMEILHGVDLQLGSGRALCMIGPNGAGKSTVLHSIYGFTRITSGSVRVGGKDITRLSPNQKLKESGVAYILQDNSVFPDMTVEENLWMGGYLMSRPDAAKEAAERIFQKYDRLAKRRGQPARVLSGGERRLLEISRALVMNPRVLLVDEPSIGLEPRYIDMVFEILSDLDGRAEREEGPRVRRHRLRPRLRLARDGRHRRRAAARPPGRALVPRGLECIP